MELQLSNVSKRYGKNQALWDFSVTLSPGIYALLGPNGSGKSTLMNILSENLRSDSGRITVDGCEIGKMGKEYRRIVGYMPQDTGMYPFFTVRQFMEYMAVLKEIGKEYRGKEARVFVAGQIMHELEAVELADVADRRIGALSGGMKKRLALAATVLGHPSVLLLDEPTAGLDPRQRILVRNYLSDLSVNTIVLIATHVVSDVDSIAKSVLLLKKGVLSDAASPNELAGRMTGKIWKMTCSVEEAEVWKKKLQVINIVGADNRETLRVISNEKPTQDAIPVREPTLEDYYLSVFPSQ